MNQCFNNPGNCQQWAPHKPSEGEGQLGLLVKEEQRLKSRPLAKKIKLLVKYTYNKRTTMCMQRNVLAQPLGI